MSQMSKEIMDVFNDPAAIKVLATIDKNGTLNNVPIFSMCCVDKQTLGCADIFMAKTKKNLKSTKKMAAVSFKISEKKGVAPTGFQVKGTFQEYQTEGPVYDKLKDAIALSMGRGIRGAIIIKVEEGWSVTPGAGAFQIF